MAEAAGDKPRWQCPSSKCGSYNFEQTNQGVFCSDCGAVIEESSFDLSVSFTDNADGSRSMNGQFVSTMCTTPYRFGGVGSGMNRESREVTIANGKKRIQQLASALRLNHFVDAALRLFLSAVQRNFVHGRRTSSVVAACLYIVCRQRNASHLLIDFSDVLQTNVYVLGNCFLKFRRLLNLELPAIDPVHYIDRFAAKLEFDDKTHDVARTAHKLVSRMKRDWIQTGRRPSGVCGAALIIAARMHGFHRTQKEVVNVMKICEETLRKRLVEFENTPSGNLTVEEFLQIDLPEEANPPAFTRNRLDEQKLIEKEAKRLQVEEGWVVPEILSLENPPQHPSLGVVNENASEDGDEGGEDDEEGEGEEGEGEEGGESTPTSPTKGKRATIMAERQQAQDAMYKSLEVELEASLKSFEEQQSLGSQDDFTQPMSQNQENDPVFGKGPNQLPEDENENENENDEELEARFRSRAELVNRQIQNAAIPDSQESQTATQSSSSSSSSSTSHVAQEALLAVPTEEDELFRSESSPSGRRKKKPKTVEDITKAIILNPRRLKQAPHREDENIYGEGNEVLIQSTEAEDDNLFKDEIDDLVLPPDESRVKNLLWTVQNKVYLEKERQDRLEGKTKRKRKRKPRSEAGAEGGLADAAGGLSEAEPTKKQSKKIDQEAWDKFFGA